MSTGVDDGEQESATALLSDDTMLQVLSMGRISTRRLISQVGMVCRRWSRLCISFLVFELVPPPIMFKPWRLQTYVAIANKYASTITKLELNGLVSATSQDIISLIALLPHLNDLSIISCGKLDMQEIAGHFPAQLVKLDLHAHHPQHTSTCFHNWDSLFDENFLPVLHKRCPQLQVLDLDFATNVTKKGFGSFRPSLAVLTRLDLHSDELGWEDVQLIFKTCSKLAHFSLVSAVLSDEEPSRDCLYPLPNLISLRLYSSPHQSAPFSRLLMVVEPEKIQHLHAQAVFSSAWRQITYAYRNIRTLDISHSKHREFREQLLTPNEENVLCDLARMMPKLERIALPTATDKLLSRFGMFCPGLVEFRIQGLGPGTRTGPRVTDRGVMLLAEGCSHLQVLSLEECDKITISSTRTIAFHCKQLGVLHLTGCKSLTDDAIQVLFPALGHCLKLLDIVGCRNISKEVLQHIQMHETSLRILGIQQALFKSSKALVRKMHPRLNIFGGSCGYVWDGFYHAPALSELV